MTEPADLRMDLPIALFAETRDMVCFPLRVAEGWIIRVCNREDYFWGQYKTRFTTKGENYYDAEICARTMLAELKEKRSCVTNAIGKPS